MWSLVSSKVFLSSLNNIINNRNDIIDVQLKIFFQIPNFSIYKSLKEQIMLISQKIILFLWNYLKENSFVKVIIIIIDIIKWYIK